jgi:putative addiction module killer protein
MKEIRRTETFIKWLNRLKDVIGRAIILERISRLQPGNAGDSRFLGDIVELRIDDGPGDRS